MTFEIKTYESLGSTQALLRELTASETLPEGLVIRAVAQPEGVGQDTNRWDSEAGMNLTFSLLLQPDFLRPEQQFLLSTCIALGALDYINSRGPYNTKALIKWPNDLYIGERKTGGILLHHSIYGNTLGNCIAGLGINLNQMSFAAFCPNPTSLKAETGRDYDPATELLPLLESLAGRYEMLRSGQAGRLEKDYLGKLYRLGEWAEYEDAGGSFIGMIKGIDAFGRLLVQRENEDIRTYDIKEISFRR